MSELSREFNLNDSEKAWVTKIFLTTDDNDRKFFEQLYYDTEKKEHVYSLNEKGITSAINYKGLAHAERNSSRALWFAGVSLILSFIGIIIQIDEKRLTEFATRGDRITQITLINHAIELCNKNPNAEDSGLRGVETGRIAPCSQVLEVYGNSTLSGTALLDEILNLFK